MGWADPDRAAPRGSDDVDVRRGSARSVSVSSPKYKSETQTRSAETGGAGSGRNPTISVGLPVRDGEEYVGTAIESLLGQTFEDLELIISDNASTDRTGEICRSYARRDQRVRYYRQPEDLSGPENWNFVVAKARGEYFKWASANDVCEPELLSECQAVLRQDESVVLCYPRTLFIDEMGRATGEYDRDFELLQKSAAERFGRVVLANQLNNAQQGLIRTEALRRTGLEREYEGGDWPLMAELALAGRWRCVDRPLLRRRLADGTHMGDMSSRDVRKTFYLRTTGPWMPFLRPYLGCVKVALGSGVGISTTARLFVKLARAAYWNRDRMVEDLKRAVEPLLPGRATG